MAAAVIRTVRGDISPGELGPCDAHEHLFLVTPAQPGDEYSDVDKAIEEATTLRAAGAQAVVDWTPIGLGRDLDGLASVAEATGLHVVAATGLHREIHYSADDPLRHESEDALADRFAAELERCGIIKVGAGYHALSQFEAKALAAAAAAHVRLGAPVCVRTEHGTMGGARCCAPTEAAPEWTMRARREPRRPCSRASAAPPSAPRPQSHATRPSSSHERSLRPCLGTTIAPRRRATSAKPS